MENGVNSGVVPNIPQHKGPDTSADMSGQWLTVQETVAYCQSKGLPRTLKTIRRWAQRSSTAGDKNGEVVVKKQDIENGYRWLIDRASLDLKIDQEKDFEQKHARKKLKHEEPHTLGTGADMTSDVSSINSSPDTSGHPPHMSVHVRTDKDPVSGHVRDADTIEFLKEQIGVKDRQIDALLERDRETNILIQGLQLSLGNVVEALPKPNNEDRRFREVGNKTTKHDHDDRPLHDEEVHTTTEQERVPHVE